MLYILKTYMAQEKAADYTRLCFLIFMNSCSPKAIVLQPLHEKYHKSKSLITSLSNRPLTYTISSVDLLATFPAVPKRKNDDLR